MKLIKKHIKVSYDETDSCYFISIITDADKTTDSIMVYDLDEVFETLSKLTKTKITFSRD